jgi:hypothetical protein
LCGMNPNSLCGFSIWIAIVRPCIWQYEWNLVLDSWISECPTLLLINW